MEKVKDRLIRVQFNADVPSSMTWNFKPLQHEIYVHPGETALIFYSGLFILSYEDNQLNYYFQQRIQRTDQWSASAATI